jgi:hypothetical protein
MANVYRKTWLYPPNWDGSYTGPGGAAPPDQPIGWKRMKLQITSLYVDTADADRRVLVVGDMFGVQGLPCVKIGITKISYVTFGMSVMLEWDMTPDQMICMIPENSNGVIEGPFYPDIDSAGYGPLETGDLLLTGIAESANDSYNITLDILVKE